MPASDADRIPRHKLSTEMKALIGLTAALNVVKYDDAELARFDRLTGHVKQHGHSLYAASEAIGEPVTCQVIAVIAGGYLYNWFEGGADAALTLPDFDEFKQQVSADDARHFDLVRFAVTALRNLAWAKLAGEQDRSREAGKSLLDLVPVILEVDPDRRSTALELALASHDMLAPSGDSDAFVAQSLAYRLLVWSKRLPFLADMAPCKFPPPIIPRFPSETLLSMCLRFVEEGILAQSIDLGDAAQSMLDDPEHVIWNDAVVEIDGKTENLRMELAFGPALAAWALDDDSEESREFPATADIRIRALLKIVCENRLLLERHRADDLVDVYVTAYLGRDPAARTMEVSLAIETVRDIVRCAVGLSEDDARSNSTRDRAFVPRESEIVDHLRASIAADKRAK